MTLLKNRRPKSSPRKKKGPEKNVIIRIADLFCGAGGTSRGAMDAIRILGMHGDLTAINHWPVAIATHEANHPHARHLCTGIDSVNPRELYPDSCLDFLWASPECTHHSTARGGRPINDQSRATAWCVIRWAEAVRPRIIQLENVPEFEGWGPLIQVTVRKRYTRWLKPGETMAKGETFVLSTRSANGTGEVKTKVAGYEWVTEMRPDKKRKGEVFRAWKMALSALGYRVEHRVLTCADYGDPTTRRRLFIYAVREDSGLQIIWPNATHINRHKRKFRQDLKPWVPTRDIIDWTHKGGFIFNRKKALAQNTLKRILVGLEKQGIAPFILPKLGVYGGNQTHGVDETYKTVITDGRAHLVEPIVLCMEHGGKVDSAQDPLRTITTAKGGAMAIVAFTTPNFGEREGQQPRTQSVEETCHTITGSGSVNFVDPHAMIVELRGTTPNHLERTAHPTDDTLGAVTANGTHHAFVETEAFTVGTAHGNGQEANGDSRRVKGLDETIGAITGSHDKALVDPQAFIAQTAHTGSDASRITSMEDTAGTICGNRGDLALIDPQPLNPEASIIPQHSSNGPRPVSDPMCNVTTTSRGIGLSEPEELTPFTLPQHSGGEPRPVSDPTSTVAATGSISLAVPYTIKFYGTANDAKIEDPLGTVTGKDRFGLAEPHASEPREFQVRVESVVEINGVQHPLATVNGIHCLVCVKDGRLVLIGIRFRMLTPKELARAQGFRPDHHFTGTKTEVVKQIGNAVPYNTARALVLAALSQKADIGEFLKELPDEAAA